MKGLLGWFGKARNGRSSSQSAAPQAKPAEVIPPSNPAFQPVNELERLLMAAGVDPESRPAFQHALLEWEIFAATPAAPQGGAPQTDDPDQQFPLLTVRAPDQSMAAAIFTSEPRIAEAFGEGARPIKAGGRSLLEMAARTGVFLNPGSEYRVHFDPAGVAGLLGRHTTRTITQPTRVLLATPAEPPHALMAQLREVLGSRADVSAAWLALAQWPNEDSSSWFLDVRTDLTRADVVQLLTEVFRGSAFEGRTLEMIVREPGEPDGVGVRVAPNGAE
jgi:hypothetical protein